MTHSWMRYDWFLSHMWHVTLSHIQHFTYAKESPLIFMWNNSFIRVTWLIHTGLVYCVWCWYFVNIATMTHSYVRPDSFTCETWLVHICDMSHTYHSRSRSDLKYLDLEILGFPIDLLSDGASVYTRENLYENLGTPVQTCLICIGTSVKTS